MAADSALLSGSAGEAAEVSRLESLPDGADPWPSRAHALRSAGIAARLLQTVHGPAVDSVWLYGSRARGDHHRESDLDILLVGDFADDQDEFNREWEALCSVFGIVVSCAIGVWKASREQFQRWDTMFYRSVRRDAICVLNAQQVS